MKKKSCRICLSINRDTVRLGDRNVANFLSTIFRINGYKSEIHQQTYSCCECKALLFKTYNFIQRILRAQKVFYDLNATNKTISYKALSSVNRKGLRLDYTLSYHTVEVDLCVQDKSPILDSEDECYHHVIKEEVDDTYFDPLVNANEVSEKPEKSNDEKHRIAPRYKTITVSVEKDDFDDKTPLKIKKKRVKAKTPPIDEKNIVTGQRKRKNIKFDTFKKLDAPKKHSSSESDQEFNPGVASNEESSEESSEYDSFDDNGKLVKKKEETREYPRKCDHCEYVIDVQGLHYRHYLFCHPNTEYPYVRTKEFVCQFCGKRCATQHLLKHHEMTHGKRTIKCDECPGMFYNTKQFRQHKYTTHSRTLFECDYCGKKMKTKPDLRLHIRTHTGEKPFKCHICGAGFAHKGNVGIHIRSTHQTDPIKRKGKKDKNKTTKILKKRKSRKQSSDETSDESSQESCDNFFNENKKMKKKGSRIKIQSRNITSK